MTEHVLDYPRTYVAQETGYWCGPASTQTVLYSRGILVDESDLARQIGTHTGGTNHIGLITPVLNRYLGGVYVNREIGNDPPTAQQKALLWEDITRSIDAGFGVVANIVAPPSNYPKGVKGSTSPAYGGGTVYHYIAVMGYDDTERAVWIADSGFRPFGYWCSFDQLATLIPPKGYAAAPVAAPVVVPPPPTPPVATTFGIDVSNHQRNFDFGRARAEGFAFATHKITEGDEYRDPYWPRARAEMAEHFPGRWGGYVFCKVGDDPGREADTTLAHAGGTDFPLQIDYEDLDRNGSIGDLLARVKAHTDRGFRLLPIYLPRWYWRDRMGSPDLSGLPVSIWNSHYVNGTGAASRLYPGNDHVGWAPFGGKDVSILQFSESASVAGQSIDVNAYRGTELQVEALFAGIPNLEEVIVSFADDELGKKFPSRSIYRATDNPVDTVAGLISNIDARQHEQFVEAQARKGIPQYVEAVRRVAREGIIGNRAGFDYPGIVDDSKRRAQAVLDEIGGK